MQGTVASQKLESLVVELWNMTSREGLHVSALDAANPELPSSILARDGNVMAPPLRSHFLNISNFNRFNYFLDPNLCLKCIFYFIFLDCRMELAMEQRTTLQAFGEFDKL